MSLISLARTWAIRTAVALLALTVAAVSTGDVAGPRPAYATGFSVSNTLDSGPGSLRQAMLDANASSAAADTITFSVSGTITLVSPLSTITGAGGPLTIDGSGRTITVDGNNAVRPFEVGGGANVTIKAITITRGLGPDGAGGILNLGTLLLDNVTVSANTTLFNGAGIFHAGQLLTLQSSTISGNSAGINGGGIASNGPLTILNSTIRNNGAGDGGGISQEGVSLTITNSTISGNTASTSAGISAVSFAPQTVAITNSTISGNTSSGSFSGFAGGGLYFAHNGAVQTVSIIHSTITGNQGPAGSGGGVVVDGPSVVTVSNSIVAGNTAASSVDCAGTAATFTGKNVVSAAGSGCPAGPTVIAANPLLAALATNGGPTRTHALLTGSPAHNAATLGLCTAAPVSSLDQRGMVRPQGAGCDIGAYEAAEFRITPDFVQHLEGNAGPTNFAFTITLSATPLAGSTVAFSAQTSDGTAVAPGDYFPHGPTIEVFVPGMTSLVMLMSGKGDTTPEFNEYFYFQISNAVNAVIVADTALGVLQNDDGIEIDVTPASLSFGPQAVSTSSAPKVVTVKNLSTPPVLLNVGALSITGPNAADFAKSADTCSNNSVAVAGQCTVSVTFTPSAAGPRSATLVIPSNDPDENPVNVPLSGTGGSGVIGGKNLTIATDANDFILLSWDGGTAQDSYTLLQYNTSSAVATLYPLPNITAVLDNTASPSIVYCYVVAALNGPTFLGLSDLLCGMSGQESGTVIPQNFNLKIGGTTNATMTWSAPAGGADSYLLQRIPLDGSPITAVPLGGGVTTSTQAVTAAGTCFQLIAFKGAGFGTSDVLCGVPGVGTLGAGAAGSNAPSGAPAKLAGSTAAPGSAGAGEAFEATLRLLADVSFEGLR